MSNQSAIINRQSAISASAPGSLMLLGEHAVLHGRRALVCAINKRMTVSLFPRVKKTVRIVSDLGNYEAPLGELTDHPDFRFVLNAVKQYPLEQGIELKIESEFSSDIGFGSSAAVTVATHAALMKWVKTDLGAGVTGETACRGIVGQASLYPESLCSSHAPGYDNRVLQERASYDLALFKRSLATILRVQGCGSGADVAASVFGGVVAYRAEPLEICKVEQASRLLSASGRSDEDGKRAGRSFYFPLTAVYSGSKMKTADVIRLVEERRALNPDYFERIFDRMDASVGEVISDFQSLGKKLVENQFLMEEMGLCNAALAEIISNFQSLEVPAKISGSGLGDCAIGLGKFPASEQYPSYSLNVCADGCLYAMS